MTPRPQVSDETLLSLLEKVNEQIAPKMTVRRPALPFFPLRCRAAPVQAPSVCSACASASDGVCASGGIAGSSCSAALHQLGRAGCVSLCVSAAASAAAAEGGGPFLPNSRAASSRSRDRGGCSRTIDGELARASGAVRARARVVGEGTGLRRWGSLCATPALS